MLNHSIFTYALAQGQMQPLFIEVDGLVLPPDTTFCAGVPFSGGRAIHTRSEPVDHWHNGMPFTLSGAMATGGQGAPATRYINGSLGVTAGGRLAINIGGVATSFGSGFPRNNQGQLCVPV